MATDGRGHAGDAGLAARLLHVEGHGSWHGTCQVGGWSAVCCYFEDIGMGLAGFFKKFTDTRIEPARMTMVVAPGSARAGQGGRSFVAWSRRAAGA